MENTVLEDTLGGLDLCRDHVLQATARDWLRSLCDSAERIAEDEDELELLGEFFASSRFDD